MFQVTRCLTCCDVNKLRLLFGQGVRVGSRKLDVTHTIKINEAHIDLRLMNMKALLILPVYVHSASELDFTLQSYFVLNSNLIQPWFFRTDLLKVMAD